MFFKIPVIIPARFFTRNIKKIINKLDLNKKKEIIEKRKKFDGSKYRLQMTPELLASMTRTRPIHLPAPLLIAFAKVFSKYKRADIYEKGNIYMKLYTVLHASEKPTNLEKMNLPFQNSVDLQYSLPDLKFQLSPRKNKDAPKIIGPNDDSTTKKKDDQLFALNYDQNFVVAYMVRKFPESFNIMNRMLHEIMLKYPDFKPLSLLDYGAGLSPSGMSFLERFPTAELIFAVEPNMYMRKMGKFLTREISQFVWAETILETAYLGDSRKFDITVCSFVLEEVGSPFERKKIVETVIDKTSENGFALFVLPGSPLGFRYLNDIREMVRSESRDDLNIIAPCPHHERCPLAKSEKTWCRFEQTWPRFTKNVLPKMPHEDVLINSRFCYLIVKKGKKIINEKSTVENESFGWDRIIKPVKRKGRHSIVTLCNRKGKIEERIVAKSHELEFGFKESKKLRWGDLWKFPLRIPNRFRKEAKSEQKINEKTTKNK